MLKQGKANIIIDGQFGSTGKGLLAGYLHDVALTDGVRIDYAVTNNAPNAGHTYVGEDGAKIVAKQLPIVGILNQECTIYLNAGAVINVTGLLKEMHKYSVNRNRVKIHPRAALLKDEDIEAERLPYSSQTAIASTQSGVGSAIAKRVLRNPSRTAESDDRIGDMIKVVNLRDATSIVEVPQGVGLGLNSGFAYPYCTGREISVSQALSDCQLHPDMLGTVFMSLRAHPIRVGHIYDVEGNQIGNSGPFWPDSVETTFEELGLENEHTTVTGRVRRIASFSVSQLQHAVDICKPDVVFLNFVNYITFGSYRQRLIRDVLRIAKPKELLLGYGPMVSDIKVASDLEVDL